MADGILKAILNEEILNKFASRKFAAVTYDYIPEDQEKDVEIKTKHKVSICTTSMNRLSDIKQTYIKNIEDNLAYGNVEFVLLNYNSTDDLDKWARENLQKYIDMGIVNYFHTTEPEFYSMTHTRNIAFKCATGDIVNNIDGDNFTHEGFAEHINLLANKFPEKTIFLKTRQKNRGRLGFFKHEFVDILGGYNEDLEDYGFDDADILCRAAMLGFTAVKYRARSFFSHTTDHKRHQTGNYKNADWKYTQRRNTLISVLSVVSGIYKANKYRHWGRAKLTKNFTEKVEV